ncbi:hypothetical protein [Streptomyces inhibens]|uniref:hypothetical protein n=1 Tax=Streptomyces inhibens TaxID=2293571 RepID=UPI001FD2B63A|nr:hypothetical protein [Streptomyces inhibens]
MADGVPNNDANDYNPKGIGTRPAFGWYLHNVDGITFRDSSVRFAADDGRPAVIAHAAHRLTFDHFTVQRGGKSPYDLGFQSVDGYCVAGSTNTSGGALRICESDGSSEGCGARAAGGAR